MGEGWQYLEQFSMGVLEAAGRKSDLKHVLVKLEPDAVKGLLHCFIDGTIEPEEMKDIPVRKEFMVRVKCADKEAGLFLTTKGKACITDIGHGPEGLKVRIDVKISSIAAYRKQVDEKGIESLEPLYNDMTTREDKKAKQISGYSN
jgi:hypothetical protein